VILLLGINVKECKAGYCRETCTLMFITAVFTIAKLWRQHRCPITLNGSRNHGILSHKE
jgi:hypothetical protein